MTLLTGIWSLDAAIVILTALLAYIVHSYSFWWSRGVPFLWPVPPIGNVAPLLTMRMPVGEMYRELYFRGSGHKIVGMYQMLRSVLMIRDPQLIKDVLVKDFAHFTDHGMYFNEKIDPLSAHLFNIEGERWKTLRNKLSPTFTSAKMKMMFPIVQASGADLQEAVNSYVTQGVPFEARNLVARFGTDVIASCAFGIQCDSLKDADSEFRTWGTKAFEPSIANILRHTTWFLFPSLGPILRLRNFPHGVSKFIRRTVADTVEYREKNGVIRNDFMQLLIQLKNYGFVDGASTVAENDIKNNGVETNGKQGTTVGLMADELAAQAFLFYVAGFETSSTVMGFTLLELALRPLIQDRVRQEIDDVLARHNGQVTYEALQEFEYMERVLQETMRKYPVLASLNRVCTKSYRVPGTDLVLEKGQLVIIPITGLHNDPEYFPNPEEYDPDRFTEEARKSRHTFSYLPFGEGPRACIGMRFAMMKTKIAIASVIGRFHLKVSPKTQIPVKLEPMGFFPVPRGGLWLEATPREGS